MKTLLILFIVSGFLLMVGCRPAVISAIKPSATTLESIVQITTARIDDSAQTPDANAQKLIQIAKERLAMKFKVSIEDIHLSSVDAVNWPDASLGCPQAGMGYTQVVTPGFKILLEAIGQTFSFHTDDVERVILCDIRPPDEIYLPP